VLVQEQVLFFRIFDGLKAGQAKLIEFLVIRRQRRRWQRSSGSRGFLSGCRAFAPELLGAAQLRWRAADGAARDAGEGRPLFQRVFFRNGRTGQRPGRVLGLVFFILGADVIGGVPRS